MYPVDSSTKYFTAVRNILRHEMFYSSMKYFTAARNNSSTKYFTTLRNVLQQYEIFYSSMKYFTAVRNILQIDNSKTETNFCISLASLETFVLLTPTFITTITQKNGIVVFPWQQW